MTDAWLPLTAAQRGLYFAHQLDPDNPCHTTAEVVEFDGAVDAGRLTAAIEAAYAQFEQLRTEFRTTADGPLQRVVPASPVDLPLVDVADAEAAEAWLAADLLRPLAPDSGRTCRTALLMLPDGRSWWYHAAHHVVLDGYGAQQLVRRVAELYAGAVPQRPVPLASVVAADLAQRRDFADADFWAARLPDLRGVVSPAGREARPAPRAVRAAVAVDPNQQTRLVEAASRLGTGWPDFVLAGVGAYVARFIGAERTRVGVPLMNRVRPGVGALPAATTVCTAMNVLPVDVTITGSIADAVAATTADHAVVRAHPLERQEDLARRLRRRDDQLFGVQVNLVPFDLTVRLDGVTGSVRNLTAGPVEDMTVTLRGTPGRSRTVRLEIDAHPDLYPAAEVGLHLDRLLAWLDTWSAADPGASVRDLPLPTPDELHAVVRGFNDTQVERKTATLGRRFADRAHATPDGVALIADGEVRTYAELHLAARAIATGLKGLGVRSGDVVGVRLPRSIALFETVHAVALLGAVYLPLDPDLPDERIAVMVEESGARHVLDATDALRLGSTAPHEIEIPDDPDAPAYLLFTSGSTGRPKGVVVGHRAIDNRLAWMQHHLPLRPGDRVLHKTPISFDVSVWELFWPLQVGATVVVAPPDAHRDPRAIADLVVRHEVVLLHFVPSMLRALLDDRTALRHLREARVRHVVTSGEALTPDLVAGCAETFGVAPTNLYGPTEAAIDVTVWDCSTDDDVVPIGRPVWNTACLVLDAAMRPQPIGVPGDLWLAGVQLAAGYVGRPDLTAERFVPPPSHLRDAGDRLYRTGDLAAWRTDGALRYLGRSDDQVKVRGQRIELGEVEATVAGVAAGAASLVGDRLVVWLVTDDPAVVESAREAAETRLPASVLPHHWVPVASLPLTTSGKVDRAALARTWTPPVTTTSSAPESLLQQRLCAAFAEVLDVPRVSPTQDFFALGGDSLRVLRLIGRVEDDLGTPLRLADVFAAPTPASLARRLSDGIPDDGTEEVLTLRPGDPAVAPLFLLPPAGGLGWCYASLLSGLPPELGVHAIQAPGLVAGRPEPSADLAALAKRQLSAIRTVVGDGRFHVAGWSLGGMAAHEVAAQARADHQEVGAVVLLDAYPADQWRHLPEPTEAEALRGILRLGGLDPTDRDLDRATTVRLLRESGSAVGHLPEPTLSGCVASVVEAARITRTSDHTTFDGDVTVVVATAPRPETWLSADGWTPHVTGAVHTVSVAATHGELVRRPAVDEVAAVLRGLLR